MKKSEIVGVGIGIIVLFFIGALFFMISDFSKDKVINENNKGNINIVQSQRLGSLCSSEQSCREFCLNNRGRC